MWMQDGCNVYMDSHMASNGSCFVVTWTIFKSIFWRGGRLNTKQGDHGTPNTHNCWFILIHHGWGLAWIEIYWDSIWLRARSHMTSHYTWGFVTILHDFGGVLGRPLDTFFWALTISWSWLLGSCVKWPRDLSLVEKVETIEVHFTLEGEVLRVQKNYHVWKSTWIPTWQTMTNVSWFARTCVKPISKR